MTHSFPHVQLQSVSARIFAGFSPLPKREHDFDMDEAGLGKAAGIRALNPIGHIDYGELEMVRLPSNRQVQDHALKPRDVLVAIRGSLQKSAIIEDDLPVDAVFGSSNLAIIRPDHTQLDADYLWCWFQNLFKNENIQSLRRSSTGQLSMTISDLQRMEIALPPMNWQHRIGAASRALRTLLKVQAETAAQTRVVFDSFLAEQFEGDTP